jgi:hypothetical protein
MTYKIVLKEATLQDLKQALEGACLVHNEPGAWELDFSVKHWRKKKVTQKINVDRAEMRRAITAGACVELDFWFGHEIYPAPFYAQIVLSWVDAHGEKWDYHPTHAVRGQTLEAWQKSLRHRLKWYGMSQEVAASKVAVATELFLERKVERGDSKQRTEILRWFRGQEGMPQETTAPLRPEYEPRKSDTKRVERAA